MDQAYEMSAYENIGVGSINPCRVPCPGVITENAIFVTAAHVGIRFSLKGASSFGAAVYSLCSRRWHNC
jgi:hypothetical protein